MISSCLRAWLRASRCRRGVSREKKEERNSYLQLCVYFLRLVEENAKVHEELPSLNDTSPTKEDFEARGDVER